MRSKIRITAEGLMGTLKRKKKGCDIIERQWAHLWEKKKRNKGRRKGGENKMEEKKSRRGKGNEKNNGYVEMTDELQT